MNTLYVFLTVTGFLCVAASCLKVLETGPTVGPQFSPVARLVLLALVFLFILGSIEALAWPGGSRPVASFAVFVLGLFSARRTFAPELNSFFSAPGKWYFRTNRTPPVA